MLRQLCGGEHTVHTAFVLMHKAGSLKELGVMSTRVKFRHFNEDTIETYLRQVHTLDKAGGYAIQEHGDLIIENYEQPLSSIIGLPIEEVGERLKAHEFDKLFRVESKTSVSP